VASWVAARKFQESGGRARMRREHVIGRRGVDRWLVRAAACVLAALVVAACGGDDDADERDSARDVSGWALPHADRDNSRLGDSAIDSENVSELAIAWRQELTALEVERAITAPPIVVDEAVYVQDAASNVWAHELEGGDELWRRKLREPAVGPNGLAYENGLVFAATPTDALALDADNGGVEWRTRIVEGPVGPRRESLGISLAPAVADGRVLLGDADAQGGGALVSLDAKTGEEQWRVANEIDGARETIRVGGVLGTPLVTDDDTVHVGIGGSPRNGSIDGIPGALRAFDGASGELTWEYVPQPLQRIQQPGPEPIEGTVPVPEALPPADPGIDLHLAPARVELEQEDAIVIAGSDGVVRVVAQDDGVQLWSSWVGTGLGTITQLAVADGMVHVAAAAPEDAAPGPESKAVLAGFDAETGEQRWQLAIESGTVSAITATNDLLLVTTDEGDLLSIDASDGTLVHTMDLGIAMPTAVTVTRPPARGRNDRRRADRWTHVAPGGARARHRRGRDDEPELSADAEDAADEVSDTPATNPVPAPAPPRPPSGGDTGPAPAAAPRRRRRPPNRRTPRRHRPSRRTLHPRPRPVAVDVAPDAKAFDPKQLEVPAGTTTFRFTNPNDAPHDFTILDEDGAKVAGTGPITGGYTYLEVRSSRARTGSSALPTRMPGWSARSS
jgi:outer membrane protein assembly factor BamB